MADTPKAGGATATLSGASSTAPFVVSAEQAGVKRVWAAMNSYFDGMWGLGKFTR